MGITATYFLINTVTGHFYVGSTCNLDVRIKRHFKELVEQKHHNVFFQELYNSQPNFRLSFILETNLENARSRELEVIKKFSNNSLMLNVSLGTNGGDNLTRNPKKALIVQKIATAITERNNELTSDQRKLLYGKLGSRNGMYGKRHTVETRIKISKANIGRPGPVGKKLSLEHRKKISERQKLRVGTSNSFYGKKHSLEMRKHLSLMAKARTSKPTNSRKVRIENRIFESVSDAAKGVGVCSASILFRIKSKNNKFSEYSYIS